MLSGHSIRVERPLGCGWEQTMSADVLYRRVLPACSLGGVSFGAGALSRLTAVEWANYGNLPYIHKPGEGAEPYPACSPKQGQPVWEQFTDASVPDKREMDDGQQRACVEGEPRAGLCYG